jgi:transposase
VDDAGKIVREARVASEPEALLQVLTNTIYRFKRIGLEAGPLSQWLYSVLAEAGLPVICVETRHMRAALKAQINKTDRNDAHRQGAHVRLQGSAWSAHGEGNLTGGALDGQPAETTVAVVDNRAGE